jgi:type VI secretion system secreted protein Hcp
MAVDIFLKLDGIVGESLDNKHKNEIVLESFSWGLTNTGAHNIASGQAGGKASFQDVHFTSKVSIASTNLMLHCANGKHIPSGQITFRKADPSKENLGFEFLFYKFDNILITSVQEAGETADRPLDSVSFAFGKINVEYKLQTPTGAVGAAVNFAWDLAANKKA